MSPGLAEQITPGRQRVLGAAFLPLLKGSSIPLLTPEIQLHAQK